MKKILITFGDGKFQRSIDLLESSAHDLGSVDSVLAYTPTWLKPTVFARNNTFILSQSRGAGFWAWKPFIILNALQNSKIGDVIIYSDAGLQIIGDLTPLYELASEKERLIFRLPPEGVLYHKARQWTKGDCFEIMGCNEEKYWEADMTNGAISVWKNTGENQEYIKEWLRFAQMPNVITDIPSLCPHQPGFKDHRHDQSILSNLRVKYDWELFRDPTQYGEIDKDYFQNSPYDQLFWHHRNFKHPKPN